jgi:hypothetical protein
LESDAKDEKPEDHETATPDLAAAVRRARVENAERAEAIADLREIEAGRLALLESALKPVVRQAPPGVDMFDLTLTQGEHPRVFLDMVAFIEMARDRRTYRFFQDTVHGRVLIAESQNAEKIVAAVTNYVARRLIERERTLVAARANGEAPEPEETLAPNPRALRPRDPVLRTPSLAPREAARVELTPPTIAVPRSFGRRLGSALSALLTMIGALTLIALIGVGAYLAWTLRLHDFVQDYWTQLFGAPRF